MADDFTSPREIAQLNIEHFTRLLKSPLDEQTRKTVEGLLAAEMAKLADPPSARRRPHKTPAVDAAVKGQQCIIGGSRTFVN